MRSSTQICTVTQRRSYHPRSCTHRAEPDGLIAVNGPVVRADVCRQRQPLASQEWGHNHLQCVWYVQLVNKRCRTHSIHARPRHNSATTAPLCQTSLTPRSFSHYTRIFEVCGPPIGTHASARACAHLSRGCWTRRAAGRRARGRDQGTQQTIANRGPPASRDATKQRGRPVCVLYSESVYCVSVLDCHHDCAALAHPC